MGKNNVHWIFEYENPTIIISTAAVWLLLNELWDRIGLNEKLQKRYGWAPWVIKRWKKRILIPLSLIIAAVLIVVLSRLTGFNLLFFKKL